ncbi:MAG: CapA family protein [Tannerella sp.]|jgi:poly-gamma-glutamate synthesis protein (capsule biosynthesis protein)|nr:CapA family protein [Tannerella sp.]
MKRRLLPLLVLVAVACVAALAVAVLHFAPSFRTVRNMPPDDGVDTNTVCRARLVFAGDLMQHTTQIRAARTPDGTYDYAESFQYVKDIFHDADVAVLNFETTLTPREPYTGYPCFRSPVQIADALRDVGIDIAALANNHICDNGFAGISFTIDYLDSCGIASTGVFVDSAQHRERHPLRFEANGIRFALLNYTYGTNGMPVPSRAIVNLTDTATVAADLMQIDRRETDCVIVFFHWGDEYARRPNGGQRTLDSLCRRLGADVVIGSHSHTIQPFEEHFDADSAVRAVTVYSLGNLVSNQRWRYSDGGLIVTLDVEKETGGDRLSGIRLEALPVWVLLPGYRILPEQVADTISMSEQQRAMYSQFRTDAHRLLMGE